MIYTVNYSITPPHDVIVQPFTSKVSRTAISSFSKVFQKYVDSDEPLKPFRITALKEEGRPLWKTQDKMVILKKGTKYTFSVTSLLSDFMDEIVANPSFNFKMYNTEFRAEMESVKVLSENELHKEVPDVRLLKIRFQTPTMLQVPRPSFKRKKNRFVLFPYVPLFMRSIVVHWNKYVEERHSGVLGLRTVYYLKEVDYRLRPVTVKYDESKNRGFTGWVLYSFEARRNTKLRKNVLKLLAYGELFGVGKSRAIGFGEYKIETLKEEKPERYNDKQQGNPDSTVEEKP